MVGGLAAREPKSRGEDTQELQQRAQETWAEAQVLCNAAQAAIEKSFRDSRKHKKEMHAGNMNI